MPQTLILDQETQTAGDLTLSEPFAPPVGIYKRRTVFSLIEFKDSKHDTLVIRQDYSSCRPWSFPNPPSDYTYHRSGLVFLNMTAGMFHDLPSDSSEMMLLALHSEQTNGAPAPRLQIYRCGGDQYVVQAKSSGDYRIEYETVTRPDAAIPKEAAYFKNRNYERIPIQDPEVLKAINDILHDSAELTSILEKSDSLPELIEFFQNFTSEPLNSSTELDDPKRMISAILTERKGLCRHRTFLFMLAARSAGYPVRIAANEIHAFAEIKVDDQWHPVELGGQANSLTIEPTSATAKTTVYSDYSFSSISNQSSSRASGGDRLTSSSQSSSTAPGGDGLTALDDTFANPDSQLHETATNQANNFIFVPIQHFPERLTRDKGFEISGQMFDEQFSPLRNTEFTLEIKHQNQKATFKTRTNENGELNIFVQLPVNWPLGKTETQWKKH